MKKPKIDLKAAIACAATALAVITCASSLMAAPAYARAEPTETVAVSRISDIADGYDAADGGTEYVVAVPSF